MKISKETKILLLSGVISLGVFGASVNRADAMSYKYTSGTVNLRQYAGTYSKRLATLPKGKKLAVYGTYKNWYRVKTDGKWGYVSKDYVTSNKTSANNTSNSINKTPVTNTTNKKRTTLKKLIVVNKSYRTTTLYENGKAVRTLPNTIGKSSTPTPNGDFKIFNKEMNRPYYKKGIAGGASNNPLGTRIMQITKNGIMLHGTCNNNSIGTASSNGCIRHKNKDIEWLYSKTPWGTHVVIDYGSNKNIANKYGYYVNY